MKLGISTACFYPLPPEQGIDEIAKAGFKTIEVFLNTEYEFSPEFIRELSLHIQNYGIEVASVHPFTSGMEGILFFSEYLRRTEDGFRQYRRYFDAARMLGAKYFTFHGERNISRDVDEGIISRKMQVYRDLVLTAGEYGITFTQENVAWCKSCDPGYLRLLYERVPELRYTLDIKQAHRAGYAPSDYLNAIGERIANVHLNDFDNEHSCLLPGEGSMDYTSFFSKLRALGFDKQVIIEVYQSNFSSINQVYRAAEFLQTYMHS